MKSLFYASLISSCVFAQLDNPPPLQYQSYESIPQTNPIPVIEKSGEQLAEGYLFFANRGAPNVPYIMTDDGELIWVGQNETSVTNLRVQSLNGRDVLTVYHGIVPTPSFNYGQVEIMDHTYKVIYTVCPELGLFVPPYPATPTPPKCQGDFHESQITPDGTILVSAYNTTRANLTSIGGGPDDWVLDSQFYELDIETGEILFSWKSLEHVNVNGTQIRPVTPLGTFGTNSTNPFDFFHINSVEKLVNGQYLVNSRHFFSMFLLESDGSIIWTFNGNDGGDFGPFPNSTYQFSFQHYARIGAVNGPNTEVYFWNNFNNGFLPPKPSTGMAFKLNTDVMNSTLIKRLYDPAMPNLNSSMEGSHQIFPNGNRLLGCGVAPYLKEYGPNSNTDVRMSFRIGTNYDGTYRGFRYLWNGLPYYPPSLVALPAKGNKGFVSWNGATRVTKYEIYAGKHPRKLMPVGKVKKSGFETSFDLPDECKGGYVQVAAYAGKTLLRMSNVASVAASMK